MRAAGAPSGVPAAFGNRPTRGKSTRDQGLLFRNVKLVKVMPSSSIMPKPPLAERYLAKTEKSGSLDLSNSWERSGNLGLEALSCFSKSPLLRAVVAGPGPFVGPGVLEDARPGRDLLGDGLEFLAVVERPGPAPEDRLQQGRLGGDEEGVLGDRQARILQRVVLARVVGHVGELEVIDGRPLEVALRGGGGGDLDDLDQGWTGTSWRRSRRCRRGTAGCPP